MLEAAYVTRNSVTLIPGMAVGIAWKRGELVKVVSDDGTLCCYARCPRGNKLPLPEAFVRVVKNGDMWYVESVEC